MPTRSHGIGKIAQHPFNSAIGVDKLFQKSHCNFHDTSYLFKSMSYTF